jgi:hypothetical protein
MSAAMTVRIKKLNKEGYPESITFPIVEAELTSSLIDELGLSGLEKFGKVLAI